MKLALLGAAALIVLAATPAFAQSVSMQGPYFPMPSWDRTRPVRARFIVLSNMQNEAVLDAETGLVWSRSTAGLADYYSATAACHNLVVGNRLGWRLPGVAELTSLLEPSATTLLKLPLGHPFALSVSPTTRFWTGTATFAAPTDQHHVVEFAPLISAGVPATYVLAHGALESANVWCVRGGQGANPQ